MTEWEFKLRGSGRKEGLELPPVLESASRNHLCGERTGLLGGQQVEWGLGTDLPLPCDCASCPDGYFLQLSLVLTALSRSALMSVTMEPKPLSESCRPAHG